MINRYWKRMRAWGFAVYFHVEKWFNNKKHWRSEIFRFVYWDLEKNNMKIEVSCLLIGHYLKVFAHLLLRVKETFFWNKIFFFVDSETQKVNFDEFKILKTNHFHLSHSSIWGNAHAYIIFQCTHVHSFTSIVTSAHVISKKMLLCQWIPNILLDIEKKRETS